MTAQTSSSRHPQVQQPEEDFATLVARFRRARGLSQGQLAKAARLSRTYIYHLETGQRQAPSIRVARAVSRALELHGEDRQKLARAYLNLTGKQMEDEAEGAFDGIQAASTRCRLSSPNRVGSRTRSAAVM